MCFAILASFKVLCPVNSQEIYHLSNILEKVDEVDSIKCEQDVRPQLLP